MCAVVLFPAAGAYGFQPSPASADSLASSSRKITSFAGFDVRPSYVFSSYKDDVLTAMLDSEKAYKTTGDVSLHLKYGFSFSPLSKEGAIFPGAWQGVGASVNFFGNSRGTGIPVGIYLFQGAPVCRISSSLSLYYEWNFGASFGWRPCDGHTASSSLITGSTINAYINIGAGLRWIPEKNWALTVGLDLTHFSNGNTSFPNPGMNMAGLRVGISRYFGRKGALSALAPAHSLSTLSSDSAARRKGRPEFDVTLYGAWRKRVYRGGEKPILLNGHFAIAGLGLSPMWKITKNFRAGASVDFQWDESTDLRRNHAYGSTSEDISFYRPSFFRQVSGGLSARAELVMPIFSVNIGMGYNVIGPEESIASYQLANLKLRIVKGFYLNIGYQLLDFSRQSNLMLGFGYSFF